MILRTAHLRSQGQANAAVRRAAFDTASGLQQDHPPAREGFSVVGNLHAAAQEWRIVAQSTGRHLIMVCRLER